MGNEVLSFCLLLFLLDFGLYEEHAGALSLPGIQNLKAEVSRSYRWRSPIESADLISGTLTVSRACT